MDTATTTSREASLYETDFHAWCEAQAALLRGNSRPGANSGLDFDNLAEEIEGLARSDRREIKLRLTVLLVHLLKWRHQRQVRDRGWRVTISNQRQAIAELIEESPSLGAFAADSVAAVYSKATNKASEESLLPVDTFPAACPFTSEQVLDKDFLPTDLDGPATP